MPRRKKLSNIEIYLVKRRLGLVPQRSYPSSRHTNPAEISSGEASDPSFSQDQFESEVPSEGGRSDQVEEAPFLLSTSIEKEEFIISWKTEPEKMLGDWQNWCRLCGKIDSDEPEAWYKAELLREQLEFVTEHFNISVEPYEDDQGHVQPLVCAECYNLLEILKSFERLCFKTDAMFKQLMRVKNFSESQLKALRWDHGVDKDKKFGECSAHLTARQSTSRNKRKRQEQQEISERDDKDSNKELFVVSYNEEKAYIVVPYEGPELEYDDFIRKACSYLKLEEISTIYDHKEIKIDAESFKFVLKKCPPEYFIIKSGNQSKASSSTSSKIQEDSEQCFSASEQYSDTAEIEIGETLIMKQEAPEVETEWTEPMLKVRRLELLQESETNEMLFEDQIMSHESPNLDQNYEDLTNEFSYLSNDESSSTSIQPNPNLKIGFGISLKEIMKCPKALEKSDDKSNSDRKRQRIENPDSGQIGGGESVSEQIDGNIPVQNTENALSQNSEITPVQNNENISHANDKNTSVQDVENAIGQNSGNTSAQTDGVNIKKKFKTFNKKLNLTEVNIIFQINQPDNSIGFQWLKDGFQTIINHVLKESVSGDCALLRLALPNVPEVPAIDTGLTPVSNLSADNIFEKLELVNQSYSSFLASDTMEVTAEIIHKIFGRGRAAHKPGRMTLEEMRKLKRRSMIDPEGPGNCLLLSTVFGIALLEENVEKRLSQVKSLKRCPKKLQKEVEKLIVDCNINRSGEHGLDEIRKIQEKHREFRFVVYNDANNFKNVLFRGDKTSLNFNKVINLFFSQNHFICIKSPKAFFAYNYQCIHCDELYNNKTHKCKVQILS